MILGDLNEIEDSIEKQGGHPFWKKRLFMKPFLNCVGGVDLGFVGKQFTWSNGQDGLAMIQQRLDFAIVNHL